MSTHSRTDFLICLALLAVTLAVYAQVRYFDFLNYDDPDYVSSNPHLPDSMSVTGVEWAFTSTEGFNWLPLTRLSYIVEYRLFGLESGPYHLTNLVLHVLASVLLFVFLLRATKARWPSAFVAFVFALHPLHVESVAWVAERKDVLCAVFWFLTLLAWVRYTERPAPGRYLLALLPFCLGLMSKPMIVTLPFVLLLLDAWPLRRTLSKNLLIEKVPFFVLSAAASVVTYLTQRSGGAVQTLGRFPFALRMENALVAYILYIAEMFWPARLAVIYPYSKQLSAWQALAAGLALAGISALALRSFRSRPYLAVGWFWYLGTLVPVIGLLQVGIQARADRYMYIPIVGLCIMLSWGTPDVVRRWPQTRLWAVSLAAAVPLLLAPAAWSQLRYWKNSRTLFQHALDVTPDNPEARLTLSRALAVIPSRVPDAVSVLETGIRFDPGNYELHNELGAMLLLTHSEANIPAALDHLRTALQIDPGSGEVYANLAAASIILGRSDEALANARAAVRLSPNLREAHFYLSDALSMEGRSDESIDEVNTALRIEPYYADAHNLLGVLLLGRPGRFDEAVRQFREALKIRPGFVEAHVNLGGALTKVPGATFEALAEFEEALRIAPDYRPAHASLGVVLASLPGRRQEAIDHLQVALRTQPDPYLRQILQQLEAQTPR